MKKELILLLTLLSWQLVMAEVVTVDQARLRAARFFTSAEIQTKTTAVSPDDFKLIGTFPEVATKSSSRVPALYFFERQAGGFAIVSGDDITRPILGYSMHGRFPVSDMPDNMRAMLQWYADIIAYAREQGWESAPDMDFDSSSDPTNFVQLQTARWHQHTPFNDLVAEVNGQKPPIGCVATAIAIVMKYHGWPRKGSGTLPSYDYSKGGKSFHIEGFPLGHEYDWDKMPDYNGSYGKEEAAQMARLLYDVAVMSKMSFFPGGSSANLINAAKKLTEYFDYDKRLCWYERWNGYSDEEWEHFIIDEINNGRPVLYSGGSDSGVGHAFVIDGYNGRYFSLNYGGGSDSHFYTLTPVEGHETDLLYYYLSHDMVCQVMPNRGGEPQQNLYTSSPMGLTGDCKVGEGFILSTEVRNGAMGKASVKLCYVLYDREGNVKMPVSSVISREIDENQYLSEQVTCRLSYPPEEGDMMALSEINPETGAWKPIYQSRKSKIVFTKRRLSDLVEVGYMEEPHSNYQPARRSDLFIKIYKDVAWSLIREEDGFQITSGKDYFDIGRYDFKMGDYVLYQNIVWDQDGEEPTVEMWILTGTYVLHLRNLATGEEMEIKLEV